MKGGTTMTDVADVIQLSLWDDPPEDPPDLPGPAPESAVGPVEFVEAVLEANGERLRAASRRYLEGPIVQHPGGWEIPRWLRAAIPQARVAQVLAEVAGEEPEGLASLEEALAYLSTASLVAPLHRDAAQMFFWVFGQVGPRYGYAESPAEIYEKIGLPEYDRDLELPLHVERDLTQLRRDIRRSVSKRR
jgi:hypothetical protein